MNISEAENILEKYGLKKFASDEFKRRTAKETGKMNVGLRLRICAEYLDMKARELREKRSRILRENNHSCPNYELARKKNIFAHEDCEFNCMAPSEFCLDCDFYVSKIQDIDESVREIRDASKVYRDEADYDDARQ